MTNTDTRGRYSIRVGLVHNKSVYPPHASEVFNINHMRYMTPIFHRVSQKVRPISVSDKLTCLKVLAPNWACQTDCFRCSRNRCSQLDDTHRFGASGSRWARLVFRLARKTRREQVGGVHQSFHVSDYPLVEASY